MSAAATTPVAARPRATPRVALGSTAAVVAVTALAAVLRLASLGRVPGNPFYDAAIHTMAGSWHAFLFGALDPGGMVSVDKPPVDLWLQVMSVKLLGFSATSLKLPQALAGTLAVPLLYDLVRRGFGRGAGLVAAAALAVLPVAVLTARSDTMDSLMMLVLVGAAWLVVGAVESERPVLLVAAGAAAGLAFNVKLFEALLPLPAFALIWLVGSTRPIGRRIAALAAAAAVALVVAFAWIVPVALTPASQRPYPIGSSNGSIWNLVFVFDGVGRLAGRPAGSLDTLPPGARVPPALARAQRARVARSGSGPGATRLFGRRYGPRIGSELLPALALGAMATLLGAIALARERRAPGGVRRLQTALALGIAVWLVTGCVLLSAIGVFHPRYFEALSPAVAATLGIGAWALGQHSGRLWRLGAAAAMYACALYLERLAGPSGIGDLGGGLVAGAAVAIAASALVVVPPRAIRNAIAALACVGLLVVPARAAVDVVSTHAFDAERSGAMRDGWVRALNAYLTSHRAGARWFVGSIAPAKAAPLIAARPEPVLMLTSYHSWPLVSVTQVAARVRAGEVRYFLVGRRCVSSLTRRTAACPATARWVMAHGKDVTPAVIPHRHHLLYRVTPAAAGRRGR